jgi:L-lactate dehydrogenase
MSEAGQPRYDVRELLSFATTLFETSGLQRQPAEATARGFLEADLLGFVTHGLVKVPDNLRWLERGETDPSGEPLAIVDRPAVANWDAHRLPGHWAMHLAMIHARERARSMGAFTMTLRRCQHVACLASALVPLVEAELVGIMMVSSPGEAFVSPFGSSARVFSNNPVAFTAPAPGGAILFDVSMAITAGGQVARAARRGERLPEAALKRTDGTVSDDPHDLDRGGSVMPLGGLGHGHKGHALTLMTEVLSQAMSGYGRAQEHEANELNSVYLQVLDPAAFGDPDSYQLEVSRLVELIEGCPPDSGASVRVPGRATWRRRSECWEGGLVLDAGIMDALLPFAEAAGVDAPQPMASA